MTVGELKEQLRNIPDNLLVVVSSDGEGNSISPLFDVTYPEFYESISPWRGYLEGEEEGIEVVALWPTN